ncbi:unnamed protein product [Zymoseptoria tritici ST99CH_1E4]|uniref:Uncharacterized protein n=1 Tax=Zymoseptoria tritici ST99CH_1E4 TaxID=1276532 RepID=A0A2H1FWD9_ZYMTR|nr:unnamed protein product [Zymoseptoria tritici ST99CH_1E4]
MQKCRSGLCNLSVKGKVNYVGCDVDYPCRTFDGACGYNKQGVMSHSSSDSNRFRLEGFHHDTLRRDLELIAMQMQPPPSATIPPTAYRTRPSHLLSHRTGNNGEEDENETPEPHSVDHCFIQPIRSSSDRPKLDVVFNLSSRDGRASFCLRGQFRPPKQKNLPHASHTGGLVAV